MFQKRIRLIFFRAKKCEGFHCDPSLPWTKGLEGKWFCHPRRIFYFHVKLWLAWLVLLYACFTLFFFDRFLLWKVNGSTPHWYPIVWLESVSKNWVWIFFFWGGFFPGKKRANWKIPKWQGSEIIFIWKMTTLEFQDFIVILRFLVKLLHLLSMLCCS